MSRPGVYEKDTDLLFALAVHSWFFLDQRAMKFGEKLESNKYIEWANSYIDYAKLKKILKKWENKPLDEVEESTPLLDEDNKRFREAVRNEMQKVERCYLLKLSEFRQQERLLEHQYRPTNRETENHSLQDSFVELYRLLNLLQNFAILNYTGMMHDLDQAYVKL